MSPCILALAELAQDIAQNEGLDTEAAILRAAQIIGPAGELGRYSLDWDQIASDAGNPAADPF